MNNKIVKSVMGILAVGLATLVQAQANLITFDDLPVSTTGVQITTTYQGLSWNNIWALDALDINGYYAWDASGYFNARISGFNVAYNPNGNPGSISSSSTFTLVSGYFTAAFNNNLNLEVQGYNGANLLYDQNYTLNVTTPSDLVLGMNNLTRVVFISSGGVNAGLNNGSGTEFALDNLTIVPEPSILSLAGLSALSFRLYRLRK